MKILNILKCTHVETGNKVVIEDIVCDSLSEEVKVVFYSNNSVS